MGLMGVSVLLYCELRFIFDYSAEESANSFGALFENDGGLVWINCAGDRVDSFTVDLIIAKIVLLLGGTWTLIVSVYADRLCWRLCEFTGNCLDTCHYRLLGKSNWVRKGLSRSPESNEIKVLTSSTGLARITVSQLCLQDPETFRKSLQPSKLLKFPEAWNNLWILQTLPPRSFKHLSFKLTRNCSNKILEK